MIFWNTTHNMSLLRDRCPQKSHLNFKVVQIICILVSVAALGSVNSKKWPDSGPLHMLTNKKHCPVYLSGPKLFGTGLPVFIVKGKICLETVRNVVIQHASTRGTEWHAAEVHFSQTLWRNSTQFWLTAV